MSSASANSAWVCTADDFDLENATLVGSGAICAVLRAKYVGRGRATAALLQSTFALKVASKSRLLRAGKVQSVLDEKALLSEVAPHPGVVKLYNTFQSDEYLYFVLADLPRGDALLHMRRVGRMSESSARHFLAQVVVVLCHLRQYGIVHRDIKLENLCFDAQCNVVLIDFDTAVRCTAEPSSNRGIALPPKVDEDEDHEYTIEEVTAIRRKSSAFCGTATTVSPEMLGTCSWSYASDLWALGCVAYRVMSGKDPFASPDGLFASLKNVVTNTHTPLCASVLGISQDAVDFVDALLRVDPKLRLGVEGGAQALKDHPFFRGVSWEELYDRDSTSIYSPDVPHECLAYAQHLHEHGDHDIEGVVLGTLLSQP